MEQLLVHCANAIEANDVTLAQQLLWVLNNIAPPDGDSNQRLASSFLRALTVRAAKNGTCGKMLATVEDSRSAVEIHKFSVLELAYFVDLTPWHRFGFTAANAAILEASEGFSVVHIVDLSLTHCMQIPTLIDAIAGRHVAPPLIKLTVAACGDRESTMIPPVLDLSYDELGARLVNFARSRNVVMEFRVVNSSYKDGFAALIEHLRVQQMVYPAEARATEALVVNCHMMLHYIPDETLSVVPDTDSASHVLGTFIYLCFIIRKINFPLKKITSKFCVTCLNKEDNFHVS